MTVRSGSTMPCQLITEGEDAAMSGLSGYQLRY